MSLTEQLQIIEQKAKQLEAEIEWQKQQTGQTYEQRLTKALKKQRQKYQSQLTQLRETTHGEMNQRLEELGEAYESQKKWLENTHLKTKEAQINRLYRSIIEG